MGRRDAGENTLGVVGFALSVVGFCAGGTLSPVGLIVSLIALGREPRGFAVAGVVIGALGSCGCLGVVAALVLLPVAIVPAIGALGLAGVLVALGGTRVEEWVDVTAISAAVHRYESEHGGKPASLDDLDLSQTTLTDPWGHAYEYARSADGTRFALLSLGKDGARGSADDFDPATEGLDLDGLAPMAELVSAAGSPSPQGEEGSIESPGEGESTPEAPQAPSAGVPVER